jgi:hypothetical protein
MNPRDFLDVADELLAGSTEASWRSAVSRAYDAETLPTAPTVLTQVTEAIRIYERDVLRNVTWQPDV